MRAPASLLSVALLLAAAPLAAQDVPDDVADIEGTPTPTATDEPFAGVFQALDGRWEGDFHIYLDTRGQRDRDLAAQISPTDLAGAHYQLQSTIHVEQEYVSETPYFQRVTIRDTYTNPDGTSRTEVSHGANKVQHGALWCVVVKSDGTTVHHGALEGEHTIIWTRDRRDPLAIERFVETVEADRYEILGWGIYEGDDPAVGPRLFFHGLYRRVAPP